MIQNNIFIELISIILVSFTLSFTLLKTFFSHKYLSKIIKNDFISTIVYFLIFFISFIFIPFIILLIYIKFKHLNFLFIKFIISELYKIKIGNYKYGIPFCLISIPIILLMQKKQDSELIDFYPFAKSTIYNKKLFLITEIFYLIFYYITWEALFRGFLQNFLIIIFSNIYSNTNKLYLIIISISLQTIISTLYHIEHPKIEIIASFFGGFLFGFIAFITDSIIYNIFIHAFLGITTDYFIFKIKNKT